MLNLYIYTCYFSCCMRDELSFSVVRTMNSEEQRRGKTGVVIHEKENGVE